MRTPGLHTALRRYLGPCWPGSRCCIVLLAWVAWTQPDTGRPASATAAASAGATCAYGRHRRAFTLIGTPIWNGPYCRPTSPY